MTDLDLDFPDPEPLTQEVKDEVRRRGPRGNLKWNLQVEMYIRGIQTLVSNVNQIIRNELVSVQANAQNEFLKQCVSRKWPRLLFRVRKGHVTVLHPRRGSLQPK